MKKSQKIIWTLTTIFTLMQLVIAAGPLDAQITANGANLNGASLTVGETANIQYSISNKAGIPLSITDFQASASPGSLNPVLDKYLAPYYGKENQIAASWSAQGTRMVEVPSYAPTGTYTVKGVLTYDAGSGAQTATYSYTFKIEGGGLLNKALGLVVKIVPEKVSGWLMSLF